jgi:hypothetical protein
MADWQPAGAPANEGFAGNAPILLIRQGRAAMSVLDVDMVDYVYMDDDDEIPVLVVSDPLTWGAADHDRHLDALRDKLNTQIAFVETGQITAVWPPYSGGPVRVEVVARCRLSPAASSFYGVARAVMTRANMDLAFRLWDA